MSRSLEANVDLQHFHTFAMPAKAQKLQFIESKTELLEIDHWSSVFVLGHGSNVIFIKDFPGTVLVMSEKGLMIDGDEPMVEAAAGECWDHVVAWCISQGAYGLENLSLIPGTVGAAPIQNIGAYGLELSDRLSAVEVFDPATGHFQWVPGAECGFGYRQSKFKRQWRDLIVTRVRLQLSSTFNPQLGYAGLEQAGDSPETLRQQIIHLRQSKLPDPAQIPNAGSFFHNPHIDREHYSRLRQRWPHMPFHDMGTTIKIPAAWLLDTLGFRGQGEGMFACYDRQPLVLTHDSKTSGTIELKGQRLLDWVSHLKAEIKKAFSIELQIEPTLVGL